MRLTQRTSLFGGIAVLSSAAVVLQIASTRLYAVLFGQQLVVLARSLPLFGLALGGVLLYLVPALARPPSFLARLAYLAGLSGAGCVASLLVTMHTGIPEALSVAALRPVGILYLTSALPFVLTAVAVGAALQHAPRHAGRLLLGVLTGAGAGGVLAMAALRAGAPRAMLFVALGQSLASVLFYLGSGRPAPAELPAGPPAPVDPLPSGLAWPSVGSPPPGALPSSGRASPPGERRANGSVVATFVLAGVVLLAGDLGAPWLKLTSMRWAPLDKAELEQWDELGLVTVDKPSAGTAVVRIDGSRTTSLLDAKTTPAAQPDELGYALHREQGPVLVIGPGGDREVRVALRGSQRDVYLAEVDPILVNDLMRGRYRTFGGDLLSRPEVHVAIAEGRSYARRSPLAFRNIVVSLSDASPPAAAGALALEANRLYTLEGFRDLLDHLQPTGTLTLTRWDGEFERVLALAVLGLRDAGVDEPADNLFACSFQRATTLLVKRTKLSRSDLDLLRRHCRRFRFTEVFAPDDPHGTVRKQIAAAPTVADLTLADSPTDLRPPTDDRPFFLYTLPLRRLPWALRHLRGLAVDNQALLVLLALLLGAGLVGALAFVVPLVFGRVSVARSPDGAAPLRALIFFGALGAGFVLAVLPLLDAFVALLGHPVYALATVVLAFLLWTGAGSLFSARVYAPGAAYAAGTRAQILAGVLAVYSAALGPFLDRAAGSPFWVRIALTLALLAPVGLLLGAQLPLGVRLLAARTPALIPWCLGLCGASGLVALPAGTLLALHLGFPALLIGSGLALLVAAAAVPPPVAAWLRPS